MLRPLLLRIGDLLEKEVTRHIDEHGPRAPAARECKRLANRRYEIGSVLNLVVMLCHGHRHIEDIRLLERIAAEHLQIDLSRDSHHRDRVHVRRCDARHKVCRAGPRGRNTDADAPRRTRITVGGMRRVLLMRHEDLTDLRLSIKCIVERQNHAAGVSKHRIHILLSQARENRLRASHFIRHPFIDRLVIHIIAYAAFSEQVVHLSDLTNFFERYL